MYNLYAPLDTIVDMHLAKVAVERHVASVGKSNKEILIKKVQFEKISIGLENLSFRKPGARNSVPLICFDLERFGPTRKLTNCLKPMFTKHNEQRVKSGISPIRV